ncbi:hypothetical protein V8C86DRAFT_563616 [Haematococcus lacustris]
MQSADDMSSGEEVQLKEESCSGAGSLSRKGAPWSVEEHCAFLKGLEKLGKGNWRGISRYFVQSRTPTQVASHAQKHFLRIGSGASKRRSRFTAIEEEALSTPAPQQQQQQQQQQPLSPAIPMLAKRAQHSTFHLHHPMNGGVSRTSPTSRLGVLQGGVEDGIFCPGMGAPRAAREMSKFFTFVAWGLHHAALVY